MEAMSALSCHTVFGSGFDAIHTDWAINWSGHFSLKLDNGYD
jgi:hypothetical protein